MPSFISVLGSYLVDGVAVGATATILYGVIRRGVQARSDAWWSSDIAIGSAFAPLITMLAAISLALLVVAVRRWSAVPPSAAEMMTAAGLALATGVVVVTLRPVNQTPTRSGTKHPPAMGPGAGEAA